MVQTKKQKVTATSADEEVELLGVLNVASGNAKWSSSFNNSLAVSYKVMQITIRPKGNENICHVHTKS